MPVLAPTREQDERGRITELEDPASQQRPPIYAEVGGPCPTCSDCLRQSSLSFEEPLNPVDSAALTQL